MDATPYDVAILPWGATEAHNYHLPYGTDTVQAEHIAIRAAEPTSPSRRFDINPIRK